MKKLVLGLVIVIAVPLFAQNHVSVPLDEAVYRIIELAQTRGLCEPLPGVKPYSRAVVRAAIDTILAADSSSRGALTEAERRILADVRASYQDVDKDGWDITRGAFHIGAGADSAADIGVRTDIDASAGWYPEMKLAGENWITAYIRGDIGTQVSYAYSLGGSPFIYVERDSPGYYHTYYEGFVDTDVPPNNIDQLVKVYSQPWAYFPFTYRKKWDAAVWKWENIDNAGQLGWPEGVSIGYSLQPELAGIALDGRLQLRFGRTAREWGAMTEGSSLVLNRTALPFTAIDATFKLLDGLYLSTLTGILERDLEKGLTDDSFHNAYSLTMLEFNYKQYFHVDLGSTSVWAKRFELGYLFPDPVSFLYQGAVGDYDNVAAFLNMKGTLPGLGKLWFSFFLDEANPEADFFELDRMMYAWQAGIAAPLPVLPFAHVRLSYTKIEPYCYTHTRDIMPWYGSAPMERAYTSRGAVGLGSYLPPNADELLLRFEAMPAKKTQIHFQYQMIRHGADHGEAAVDGSALFSELDPGGRSEKLVLKKFFLRDGAYQWMHIAKIGIEHTVAPKAAVPVRFFAETGVVFSYYTGIDGPANSGSPSPYHVIDTAEYPKTTSFIAAIGVRIFP